MFVKSVIPRVILNSRRDWTIEIALKSYEGIFKCSAPSGKSTGKAEVATWNKKGVKKSYILLKRFCKKLINQNFIIKKIDNLQVLEKQILEFEKENGVLGGNVWYALEGVFLRAAAADVGKELWQFLNDEMNKGLMPRMPMPIGNCVGGGLHSKMVDGRRPDFQEFLLIGNEDCYGKAFTKNFRAYERIGGILAKKMGRIRVRRNDEGAWNVGLTNEEVLNILGRLAGRHNLKIGLDVASSTFYNGKHYKYSNKKLIRDVDDQIDYMVTLVKKYKIFYLEDGADEEDFGGFAKIIKQIHNSGEKEYLVVGDDLTTTNLKRVHRAARNKSINAMIIKPNQIGSMIEVKSVVEYCKRKGIVMIFSHRSGETMDDILADYCIGFGGQFLKSGIYGKERLVKAKRIMDIEKNIQSPLSKLPTTN